jgi:hypothetical protein
MTASMTLVERLRREDHIPTFTDSVTWALVNPDGPEAADALETAEAENRELRQIIASLGYCTADTSLEFMRLIPDEVRLEKIRSGR